MLREYCLLEGGVSPQGCQFPTGLVFIENCAGLVSRSSFCGKNIVLFILRGMDTATIVHFIENGGKNCTLQWAQGKRMNVRTP